MIIEVLGAPGAGKTTLLRSIGHSEKYRILNLDTLLSEDDTFDLALAALSNPGLAVSLLTLVRRGRARSTLRLLVRDRQQRRAAGTSYVFVVDDGALHRLLWLLSMSCWREQCDVLSSYITRPDLALFLPVDADVALARVGRRQLGGDALLRVERPIALGSVRRYGRLAKEWCEASGVPFIVVDGPRDAAAIIEAHSGART